MRLPIRIAVLLLVASTASPLLTLAQQTAPDSPASGRIAQQGSGLSTSSESEHESVKTEQRHRYASPAERANDALKITEVKTALANDGVAQGHAVEVDCDHGTVLLTGMVDSAADSEHAAAVASGVEGVVAVNNRLSWPGRRDPKSP
jgi:osmotically-inducible protein OsmY